MLGGGRIFGDLGWASTVRYYFERRQRVLNLKKSQRVLRVRGVYPPSRSRASLPRWDPFVCAKKELEMEHHGPLPLHTPPPVCAHPDPASHAWREHNWKWNWNRAPPPAPAPPFARPYTGAQATPYSGPHRGMRGSGWGPSHRIYGPMGARPSSGRDLGSLGNPPLDIPHMRT